MFGIRHRLFVTFLGYGVGTGVTSNTCGIFSWLNFVVTFGKSELGKSKVLTPTRENHRLASFFLHPLLETYDGRSGVVLLPLTVL